jgi:dUTP pyrophosphatase
MSVSTILEEGATLPTRGDPFAAGLDLYALEDCVVGKKQTLVKTGVRMAIPKGYWGNIRSRSSLALKHGVFTEAGVIDSSYRGPIGVVMYCISGEYQIKKGDRIAQLIIQSHSTMNPVQVETLPETQRGEGGFGSTGK